MATSGYGNRLAGGNQFFQGPKGARLALGTRGAPRRILSGAETLPNLELPPSPPPTSNTSLGWAPDSTAPPPVEAPPTPKLLIDELIIQGRPELSGISHSETASTP